MVEHLTSTELSTETDYLDNMGENVNYAFCNIEGCIYVRSVVYPRNQGVGGSSPSTGSK